MTKYSFGIIGYPLQSTLSPHLHTLFYQYYGIHAKYSSFPLKKEDIAPFLSSMRNSSLKGLSVTLPYKEYVLSLLDSISPKASLAGAVNTITEDNGKLLGDNTDIFGILATLAAYTNTEKTALILGSGGAARSAIIALQQKNIHSIVISGRIFEKSFSLATEFSLTAIENTSISSLKNIALIINTTPLGSIGYEHINPISQQELLILKKNQTNPLSFTPLFFDMNYTMHSTLFEQQVIDAKWDYLSGLTMFLAQAQQQFAIWKKYLLL